MMNRFQSASMEGFTPKDGDRMMVCEHVISEGRTDHFGYAKDPNPVMFKNRDKVEWMVVCIRCCMSKTVPEFHRATWNNGEAVYLREKVFSIPDGRTAA